MFQCGSFPSFVFGEGCSHQTPASPASHSANTGAFSRAQAYDAGIAPHTLRAGVRSGRWTTPHRDVFVIAGTPSTYEQCVMTAQLCAGRGAAAAARTAARLWKLTERDNKCVQLLVPAERHLAIPGVEIIRTRNALAKDFTHIGAIRITTPTR